MGRSTGRVAQGEQVFAPLAERADTLPELRLVLNVTRPRQDSTPGEREALVMSANFTEAARERNVEAGVLVRELALARQLRAFCALIESGAPVRLGREPGGATRSADQGFCTRPGVHTNS